jgi:acetyltransferase-like isoleucine patch superfamily enzyme
MGEYCSVNAFSKIVSLDRISIGNNVVIASYVSILDHDHDVAYMKDPVLFRQKYKTGPISIGNNVWIGDKVTILKGVTIGDNVVIAANSVVTKNIASNTVAGGIPARFLKEVTGIV